MKKLLIILVICAVIGVRSIVMDRSGDDGTTVTVTLKPLDETVEDAEEIYRKIAGTPDFTASAMEETGTVGCYRIRRCWDDTGSQIGAYVQLAAAIADCPVGYSVYDENGTAVYTG